MTERVYCPDGRWFTLRADVDGGGDLCRIRATTGRGTHLIDVVDPMPATNSCAADVRARMVAAIKAIPSVYLDPPAPPTASRIDRIRELTAWVAELDQCEARAVELRGLIEGAAL
jgi:hypothetical protein